MLRNECVEGHNGASSCGWHSHLLGGGAANKTCQGSTQEMGLGVNLFQDMEQKVGELCSKLAQHPEHVKFLFLFHLIQKHSYITHLSKIFTLGSSIMAKLELGRDIKITT